MAELGLLLLAISPQTVQFFGLVFIGIGILLLIVEICIPGFGAPGIAGVVCLLVGIFCAAKSLGQAFLLSGLVLLAAVVVFLLVMRSAARGKLADSPLILKDADAPAAEYLPGEDHSALIGTKGVAVTMLRPSGIADFQGERLDVVSKGEFLPQGTALSICEVDGTRVVVEEVVKEK